MLLIEVIFFTLLANFVTNKVSSLKMHRNEVNTFINITWQQGHEVHLLLTFRYAFFSIQKQSNEVNMIWQLGFKVHLTLMHVFSQYKKITSMKLTHA